MKLMRLTSLFLVGLLVLTACGANGFDIAINENIEAEYGEELDHTILYDAEKSEKDLTVKEVRDFDKMKIGEQEITVVFALGEDTQEEKVKINVKDTNAPEITFKSETVEIALGDSFDAASNLESVKDPVDGDIAQSNDNTIIENGYFFGGDPISSEAGEYTVTVTAFDKNGNKSEKSYKLIIKEKQAESDDQPVASNQGGSSQAPTQSGGKPSGGNTGNAGNSGSSNNQQPVPEKPSKPTQTCDGIHPDSLGNTGMVFNTKEEAIAYGDKMNEEQGARYYYGNVTDMCGNPIDKWTVSLKYMEK